MKFKIACPTDVLTQHRVSILEQSLADNLLRLIISNFPDWGSRAAAKQITGGEIILQNADWTAPIKGLKPGIHVTVSLVSFKKGRDFDGLGKGIISLLKNCRDGDDPFMRGVGIFLQMTLDRPVMRPGTGIVYEASGDGLSLLEYND